MHFLDRNELNEILDNYITTTLDESVASLRTAFSGDGFDEPCVVNVDLPTFKIHLFSVTRQFYGDLIHLQETAHPSRVSEDNLNKTRQFINDSFVDWTLMIATLLDAVEYGTTKSTSPMEIINRFHDKEYHVVMNIKVNLT